ncbi:MAG: hypothetical protein J2P35_02415 [Actinobacteria bacterium]|nr:hypothetical protein [Actinomycetota bacterium]MBO0784481.1 hypothetical protein [Actinomycetota bacterium]MBO0815336.1 hypothetical protein [Actinomycetota bacterium]
MRFPRHGADGHPAGTAARRETSDPVPGSDGPASSGDPVPDRSCCCLARPAARVTMPAGGSRAEPVDLWLCGHHLRASGQALDRSGAEVLVLPPAGGLAEHPAPVS